MEASGSIVIELSSSSPATVEGSGDLHDRIIFWAVSLFKLDDSSHVASVS